MASLQKHIERRIRRAFIGSLGLLRGGRGDAGDLARLDAPRILLIRPDRIGDAIVSTPVMTLLRERFPAARIDILLGAKNGAAGPILPALDGTIMLGTSRETVIEAIRWMRRNRYDVAINLLAKDSASGALMTGLSRARIKIGFAGATDRVYDIAVERPEAPSHIVRQTTLLLAPFGIDPIGPEPGRAAERLSVAIPEPARDAAARAMDGLIGREAENTIALNISGSGPEKFWGIENFAGLARELRTAGMTPLIAAAPADREPQELIATRSGAAMIPISRSYAEFAAMLDRAAMIMTPDTSVVHLAAALGKPTVMLVGTAATGTAWAPWGTASRVISGDGALGAISPRTVADAILDLRAATLSSLFPSTAP